MKRVYYVMGAIVAIIGVFYIRYQKMDIEIARFDYMMRVYKEEHSEPKQQESRDR